MSSEFSSFYQSLQPLFVLTKTFGLFPLKLSHDASVILIYTRKELFLPIVWFFVSLAAGICTLIGLFSAKFEDKILQAVYTAYFCFLELTALSSITTMWINRKKVNEIFRNLLAVDQLLDNSTRLVLYKQSRSSFIKTVSFVSVFVTTVAACFIYFHYGNSLYVMVGEITLNTMNIIFIFQYVTIVQGVRLRYYQLWHILKTLPKEKKEVSSQMVGCCIYNSHIADTLQISILRDQHFNLSNVVSLLNEVYSLTILLEIVTALSNCVGSVYEGIQILNRDENPMESLAIILSGALLFAPVIWMAMSCHQVDQQNEHIREIQKLLISKSVNQRNENELKELLLQINLMKSKFNAGGFFNLNLKFLCTSFSSIFTYIIILSQMK
ncbi:hypothetical protein L9F63_020669 [Diploptera punctata]|uniref:Gustatory receptor n=1 Tax=Diploptera punctata TaxID=6984 RepID=A0AAD7ZRT9_DIPPU|nr:hypothetical protein L9F63_020669 [Diploptera punctata]